MLKVLSVFGTRPEAIKLAPVIRAMRAAPEQFEPRICATGQHRELLDPVLRLFDLRPDHDLRAMQPDQSLADLTARLLTGLAPILSGERPDWVLVQGDTTSTLAAALAAYYARIPVAHVEAGLRSRDPYRPFPEEQNRRLTDALAALHFAPTEGARQNLLAEGLPAERIRVTGNTVIDALLEVAARPYDVTRGPLAALPFSLDGAGPRLVLVTTHRRESFGAPLEALCRGVAALAGRYPDARFVLPVHLNPNVQAPVHALLGGLANVHLTDPLDYEPFVHLMKRSALVLSDSGGVQEEAPALGVPVLVVRQVTERPEGVAAGAARVVGTGTEEIVAAAARLLDDPAERARMAEVRNPYGDGQAARRITQALLQFSKHTNAFKAAGKRLL